MFEETISVVSIWTAMNSWLTPTVLFVVLNIMIGTIAVTSGLGTGPKQHRSQTQSQDPTDQQSPLSYSPGHLTGSPSVLQRLRSIRLYRSEKEPPQSNPVLFAAAPNPSLDTDPNNLLRRFETQAEENSGGTSETQKEREAGEGEGEEGEIEAGQQSMDEVFSRIQGGEKRSFGRSMSEAKPGVVEAALAAEKKGPKNVKKFASDKAAFSHFEVLPKEEEVVVRRRVAVDEEVDAKAADFISKFREQLKLQKMESLMSGGGSSSTEN